MSEAYVISIGDRDTMVGRLHQDLFQLGIDIKFPHSEYVDGHDMNAVEQSLDRASVKVNSHRQIGEIGVWCSNLNVWKTIAKTGVSAYVFEDDAYVTDHFRKHRESILYAVPASADFFSFSVPEDQRNDFYYRRTVLADGSWTNYSSELHRKTSSPHYVDEWISTAYQGYGFPAMYYTPKGAKNILKLARESGITEPVDVQIFAWALAGKLKGYTMAPWAPEFAYHLNAKTQTRTGEYYDAV